MASPTTLITRDWANPRTACAFTGYSGGASDGPGGPAGTLLLCVNNNAIPCKEGGMEHTKSIMLTIINVHKKGWSYAPWKKQTGKAKVVKDENRKELFEYGAWARDEITMERVGQSIKGYSFLKDGQNKGERVDDASIVLSAGTTLRVNLKEFMFESKKNEGQNVFPADLDVIPAFSVVEVMINMANTGNFEKGYGIQVSRIRPCDFSLHSLNHTLGLGLLASSYERSIAEAERQQESNLGVKAMLETKNTGFYGAVTTGSYLVKYNDDFYRLVGPHETPGDDQSRHVNVIDGVCSVDIPKDRLMYFTNAPAETEAEGLNYSHFLVDLAAAAGALGCYVVYNEYVLRSDQNRSPYLGVPLIDTKKLLDFIKLDVELLSQPQTFQLPFEMPNMQKPYVKVNLAAISSTGSYRLPTDDFVLAYEETNVERGYELSFGDEKDADILTILYVPKTRGVGSKSSGLERVDYRQFKRLKASDLDNLASDS